MSNKKISFETLTGRSEDHLEEYHGLFVHKNLILNFEKLKKLAKEEIGAELAIISGFRSYDRQLKIWNEKFSGARKVLDEKGNIVDINALNDLDKIKTIMRFSALPGASRHHWGSDIDVYDAHLLDKADVELTPAEVEAGGVFYELHEWISNKIDLNESYDFYRPYKNDHGGVHPEAWHLSLKALSYDFFASYTLETFTENLNQSEILGKDILLEHKDWIFETYFKNIDLE